MELIAYTSQSSCDLAEFIAIDLFKYEIQHTK